MKQSQQQKKMKITCKLRKTIIKIIIMDGSSNKERIKYLKKKIFLTTTFVKLMKKKKINK